MNKKAHLAGFLFASIFGFSFLFSKIALTVMTPIGLISYRFLLAFLVFEGLRFTKVVKIRFQWSIIRPAMIVAFFQPVLYFLFETYGLALTTSSEAGMMIALIPVFVSILGSLFLKEKPKPVQILFILLSVSGVFVIQFFASTNQSSSLFGFALLMLAVLSAALFNIASRKASTQATPFEITYYMMMTGAFVFHLIYFVQLGIQGDFLLYFTPFQSLELLGPILYLGIVASIGGFFLVNYALSQLEAHVSSIYSNLSTIVAMIAGSLILQEGLYWNHLLGGSMILIGVYGTVWFGRVGKRVSKIIKNQSEIR